MDMLLWALMLEVKYEYPTKILLQLPKEYAQFDGAANIC